MDFGQTIGCSIIGKVVITAAFPCSIISSLSYILDFEPDYCNRQMGFPVLHSSVVEYRIIVDHIPGCSTIVISSRPCFNSSSHHIGYFATFLHRNLATTHSFAKWQRPY